MSAPFSYITPFFAETAGVEIYKPRSIVMFSKPPKSNNPELQSLIDDIQAVIDSVPKNESRYPIYMGIPEGLTEQEEQQVIEMGHKLANIDVKVLLGIKE